MRNRLGQAGSSWLITVVVALVGLCFGAILLWALKEAVEASAEVVVTVVAVVSGFLTTQWLQRRVEREKIKETRRAKLAPHYEKLLTFVREAAKGKGSQGPKLNPRHEKFWVNLTHNLVLWGSPELVTAWAKFMREIEANEADASAFLREYLKVLHAIRIELGHQDSGLAARDLLKLFMTDADELVPADVRF